MPVYLLYADETNLEPAPDVEFFIYGGIWLPVDRLAEMNDGIDRIRGTYGFQPGDELKFASRTRPVERVSADQHLAAKREVLELCLRLDVRFSAVVILHDIARLRAMRWGIQADALLLAFRDFLNWHPGTGLVILDRFDDIFPYIVERFQRGVSERSGRWTMRVHGVHLFAAGVTGSSHLASAADIVLGSFRYCVNDTAEKRVSKDMLGAVLRLMWKETVGGKTVIRDMGLLLRPKNVAVPAHKARYDELIHRLERLASPERTP